MGSNVKTSYAKDWQGSRQAITLTALLLSALSSSITFAESGRTDYDLDDNGLIEINDLADLNEIRNNLDGASLYNDSSGCPVGGCNGFELTEDLNFDTNLDGQMDEGDTYWNASEGWLPIGNSNAAFTGIFEGNDQVVKNLYIDRTGTDFIGLFGYINQSQIRQLGLSGPLMSISGDDYVGSLVGWVNDDSLISGSYSAGAVNGGNGVGGLVGRVSNNNQITTSYNTGSVQGEDVIGGLVGWVDNSNQIISCFNSGVVQGRFYSGGITGAAVSGNTITNSFNTGSIVGLSDFVGGLVGAIIYNGNHIGSSYSSGIVSDVFNAGGLIGVANFISNNTSTVENSYWATDTSGQATSHLSSENNSYVGLPLATLMCAIQADTNSANSDCVSEDGSAEDLNAALTLYNDWNDTLWDFGDDLQLPALYLNGVVHRDSDNDGILDEADAFPLNSAASLDEDQDGYPDAWNIDCGVQCQLNSELVLDQQLNDTDNDGVINDLDTDNSADNGVPELSQVATEMSVMVDSEDSATVALNWDEAFLSHLNAYDVMDGYSLDFEARLKGELIGPNDNGRIHLPAGRLNIEWVAVDAAGNRSNTLIQVINVYPQVRFELTNSVVGDNSTANIIVELSGESPEYPVVIDLQVNLGLSSDNLNQYDFDFSFDIYATHQVIIERGDVDDVANTQTQLVVPVVENSANEYDEYLVVDLVGVEVDEGIENLYAINESNRQHILTLAYQNIAPQVQLVIEQDGQEITHALQDGGPVTITVLVIDGNDIDQHTLEWGLDELNLDSPAGRVLTFDPASIAEGSYTISVKAIDTGENNLSGSSELQLQVVLTQDESESEDDLLGGGSLWWLTLLLTGLVVRRRA